MRDVSMGIRYDMTLIARDPCRTAMLVIGATIAWGIAGPVCAQTIDGTMTLSGDVDVRGRGWEQIYNTDEIVAFILGLAEAMVLTALLAFHPKTSAKRRDAHDWLIPQGMFLFALIGLLVGFLVLHHGYLIGFVIFGVGSLFRFRMEAISLGDTALMILVALVGLTLGLDLPVVAVVATVGAWIVAWLLGARSHHTIKVKFEDAESLDEAIGRLRAWLEAKGFRVLNVARSKHKPAAEFLVSSGGSNFAERLDRDLTQSQQTRSGIKEWIIE